MSTVAVLDDPTMYAVLAASVTATDSVDSIVSSSTGVTTIVADALPVGIVTLPGSAA